MKLLKVKIVLFSLLMLVTAAILLTSCEQETILSGVDSNETMVNDMEGFKSTTNNADSSFDDSNEVLEPIFSMSFDGDLTREEADAQWAKAVEEYKSNLNSTELENRAFSTEWFFYAVTRTGTQTSNDTDAKINVRVGFNTSKGYYTTPFYRMNNPGNDFEKGDWNYFFFRTYIPYEAVEWVEAKWGQLALKGTDGWFVTNFNVFVSRLHQTLPASGYTYMYSQPNVWLDNPSSGGWDYFYSGWIGNGRLNF